jgi:Fe-Mn family superoxide dismutase
VVSGKEISMVFQLPKLPFAIDALEPHISAETLETHHGKHHKGYVDKLNELAKGTRFAEMELEDVVQQSGGDLFNNAAQAWNHAFYWQSLSPGGGGEPKGELAAAIARSFGSFREFKRRFGEAAAGLFGSGWVWLVRKPDGSLGIVETSNADNPLVDEDSPLLTCDVWEHAYYLDRRNDRAAYVEAFWELVHWQFAAGNLETALPLQARSRSS